MKCSFTLAVMAACALTTAVTAVGCTMDNFESSSVQTETTVQTAVLKQGSSGSEVKEVQRRLKLWGYYKGSVDGVFGASTKSAVIAFQKKNGLTADGVVGKSTYKALGMTNSYNLLVGGSSSGQGANGFSSSDVYLLAKTIYAEGRGEPYTGQVAIGAVVLNRVRSSQFPNKSASDVAGKPRPCVRSFSISAAFLPKSHFLRASFSRFRRLSRL